MRNLRVLVPTRGSLPALRACNTAAYLLPADRTEIRLMHVLTPELYPYPQTPDGKLSADAPKDDRRRVMEVVEQSLMEPRRIFEEVGHEVELTHSFGDPAQEILREIEGWPADLVVMGRWWEHAPEQWVEGSIFERVMRKADVPVLVVSYSPELDRAALVTAEPD